MPCEYVDPDTYDAVRTRLHGEPSAVGTRSDQGPRVTPPRWGAMVCDDHDPDPNPLHPARCVLTSWNADYVPASTPWVRLSPSS